MELGRAKVFILALSYMLILSPVSCASENKITGIYSSLRFNKESGDLLGEELFLVKTRKGYQATFQISDGGPSPLMLVDVEIKGGKVFFRIGDGMYAGMFYGEIKNNKLVGVLKFTDGGESKIVLPRKEKSYWQ